MAGKTDNTGKITKSIQFKDTDNPMILDFVNNQTNFTRAIRFLILYYCKQNGVEDLTEKFNTISEEYIFNEMMKKQGVDLDNNKSLPDNLNVEISQNEKTDDIKTDIKESIPHKNKIVKDKEKNDNVLPAGYSCFED